MKVICPHCQGHNQVVQPNSIRCYQCHNLFPDDTYLHQNILQSTSEPTTTDSKIASIIVAMSVGAVACYGIDNYLDEKNTRIYNQDRYPFEVEYSLVTNCASADNYSTDAMSRCLCALKEAQKSLPYDEVQNNLSSNFHIHLRDNKKCS